MTILVAILRALGIPLCIFVGMFGYYEGMPVLRDIPYISVIPVMGELATGRVATETAKAATAARAGYVELSEATALKAQLDEERRSRLLASQLYDQAQQRAAAAENAKEVADKNLQRSLLTMAGPMAILGSLLILTGCRTTEARQKGRVVAAAQTIGVTRTQTIAPELPPECRRHMERIYPKLGEKVRWTQKRWEYSADQVDAKIDRCAQFHDEWKSRAQ